MLLWSICSLVQSAAIFYFTLRMAKLEGKVIASQSIVDAIMKAAVKSGEEREKEEQAKVEKLKGANRKPRTDEQKLAAAERRRQWWAKKKASESQPKIPDAVVIIKNEI